MEAIFRLMVLFLFLLLPQATEGKAYCTVTVCEWGDWGRWSECDKTCGGFGKQFRRRPKAHEALCGGKGCDGEFEQEKPCNRLCHNGGTLQHDGKCSCPKDYRGSCCQNHFPSCPIKHCEWGDWGRWSECDKSCGGFGKQFRRRSKKQTAACGGKVCDGDIEQEKPCNRLCYNGGTLQHGGKCLCPKDYHGLCCEEHGEESSNAVFMGLTLFQTIMSTLGIIVTLSTGAGIVCCVCCNR